METDEDTGTSADAPVGESGGVLAFLSTLRGILATLATLLVAVGGLITVLHNVGLIGGGSTPDTQQAGPAGPGPGPTTPGSTQPPPTQPDTTGTTLTFPFAAVTRPNGRVYFEGAAMYFRAATAGQPLVHLVEREDELGDVSLSARATWVSGSRDYGIGFVCRYRNAGNYYFLSVLSRGRYQIGKYRNGRFTSLTGGIQEGGGITGDETEVGVRCVGESPTLLTLSVGGRVLRSVSDAEGIPSGTVGVRVGTGEGPVTFRFDRFELRHL